MQYQEWRICQYSVLFLFFSFFCFFRFTLENKLVFQKISCQIFSADFCFVRSKTNVMENRSVYMLPCWNVRMTEIKDALSVKTTISCSFIIKYISFLCMRLHPWPFRALLLTIRTIIAWSCLIVVSTPLSRLDSYPYFHIDLLHLSHQIVNEFC
jgi:hypothetical protein